MGLIVFAGPSTAGLTLIIGTDLGLLLCAGVFDSAFATYRMQVTTDQHLARVAAAWAITGKIAQPIGLAAAGLAAAAIGARATLGGLAIVLVSSIAIGGGTSTRVPDDLAGAHPR